MKCCDMCGRTLKNPLLRNGEVSYPVVIYDNIFQTPLNIELSMCSKCRSRLIRFIQFEQARNRKGGAME